MTPLFRNWRFKTVLPVVGVLLLGLVAFQIVMFLLETPSQRWIFLVAASGAVVICIVLLVALAVLVNKPLAELNDSIGKLRDGDMSVHAEFAARGDDIGELGRHFNDMVDQLRSNREEIERLHNEQMLRAEHLASLGELAAGLAHEIRNPLAGIAGAMDIMSRNLPANHADAKILLEVRNQVSRIQGILTDLLDYARPKPSRRVPADLNMVAEQAVFLARQQISNGRIELAFVPVPELPLVVHDPARMQQVLLNLILNGIQAISGAGRVELRLSREGSFAIVSVADSGRGMPADDLAKIFRPFFSTKLRGTGLGLPLAKGIVEEHGGQIEVASALGKGTTITIRLPLAKHSV
jgi:two-component system NtrC family sensor kinase